MARASATRCCSPPLSSIVRLRLSGLRVRERDPDDVAPREIVLHEVLATLGRGLATVDGFLYALVTAGTFGWLWPS